MSTQQLTFDIDLDPSFAEKDFVVGECNKEARLWIHRWPNWPNNALIIYGPKGSGKSHLGNIWQSNSQALTLDGAELTSDKLHIILSEYNTFLLDNAEDITDEESLFHLYNHVKNSQGTLLILSQTPPNTWKITLPDLRSRMNAIVSVQLHNPDDHVLTSLYRKLFADQQIHVSDDVIRYLTLHGDRSYKGAENLAHLLNKKALSEKKPISLPLTRRLFVDLDRQ